MQTVVKHVHVYLIQKKHHGRFNIREKSCMFEMSFVNRQACWDLANQANYHNISGPKCASDGSFYAQQCDKITSKCSCVTPSGIHIKGFQSRPEENVNCGKIEFSSLQT